VIRRMVMYSNSPGPSAATPIVLQCLDTICIVNRYEEWTPERNAIGHTPARFKRSRRGTNSSLECKFLSKVAHRTYE
jgi:hypothetical protein